MPPSPPSPISPPPPPPPPLMAAAAAQPRGPRPSRKRAAHRQGSGGSASNPPQIEQHELDDGDDNQQQDQRQCAAAARCLDAGQLGNIGLDEPVEWVGPGDDDYISVASQLPTTPIELAVNELRPQPPFRRLWHQEGAYVAVSDVPRASAMSMLTAVDERLYEECVAAGAEQPYPPRGSRYVMRGGAVSEGGGHENKIVNSQRGARYFTPPEEEILRLPHEDRRNARAALSHEGVLAQQGARFGRHLYPRRFGHSDDPSVQRLYEALEPVYEDAARAVQLQAQNHPALWRHRGPSPCTFVL